MAGEDKNPAKLIVLLAFALILVFLIIAIDSLVAKIAFGFILLLLIVLAILSVFLERRKKTGKQIITIRDKRTKYEPDEGFIIKKTEQSSTQTSPEKLNPRDEFRELLRKVLFLIKDNIVSNSAAFYWANEEKKQMVFEEGITDLGFNFVRRYNWNDDALTIVAKTGMPKIIGDINSIAEEDVIKYQSPKVGVKSLLVCPVFYKGKTIGVILLDSKEAHTFSENDVKNVEHFSDLISDLIGNYITKFELYYKAKILEFISENGSNKIEDVLSSIQNFAVKVLDCVAVAVVLFENGKWVVALGYSKLGKYIDAGTEVKIEGTLIGEVINKLIPKVIPSTRLQGKVIRFTDSERINIESSIAAVPIIYGKKCYGAMLFEHSKPNFFSSYSEIKKLEELATVVGILLENMALSELVENYFMYDDETTLMRKNYFYNRLDAEIERKKKHGGELTLVLISVDSIDYIEETYGVDAVKVIRPYIGRIIKSSIDEFDLAGRLDDNLIGVALVESGVDNAHIWAEKLRKTISTQEIKFKDRSFAVTITAGVSAWNGDLTATEFISRVNEVFTKVRESGSGNLVKVF
jgi:diguanylate cyclase (GGDEF)-like protein